VQWSDVEVVAEAVGERVEHLPGPAAADVGGVDDDVGGQRRIPLVMVQACRIVMSTTPATPVMWSRTLTRSTPGGALPGTRGDIAEQRERTGNDQHEDCDRGARIRGCSRWRRSPDRR
jgi:hypothetical protein